MRIETSTVVQAAEIVKVQKILRDAAVESKNEKFFGLNEKIEVVNNPSAPPVGSLVKKSHGGSMQSAADVCDIAYAAALKLCGGDTFCQIAAQLAYEACEGG